MSVEREQAKWLRSTTINCVSSNTQREIEEQIEVKNKQVPSQSVSADCKRERKRKLESNPTHDRNKNEIM